MPQESNESTHSSAYTRSEISGAAGDVVQARDVRGGIHFHYSSGSRMAPPRQLPRGIRVFINRESDINRLDQVLRASEYDDDPVVAYVIAGTAGVGKTSLALHWAHRVSDRFPDGQLYTDLRGYDPGVPVTPDQALESFLFFLGVPAAAIPSNVEAKATLYRSLLADRRMLIVVDNAGTVGQVRPLLPGVGRNLVIVTSRSSLSGLMVRDGARRTTLDTLPEAEAVVLLSSTMAGYRQGDDPSDIAELARLCAYLPLALRVAAERAASRPGMPLGDLIDDLRDESALWDALSTDDADEASAVRSVFAWSYRALSKTAARLFCLLGLHPGSDFSERAAAALAGSKVERLRTALDTLVGAYLVEDRGNGRYRFHDLLRAYAVDRVRYEVSQEEQLEAVRRICVWYLHSTYSCVLVLAHDTTLVLPPVEAPTDPAPLTFEDRAQAARWYAQERSNLVGVLQAAEGTGQLHLVWRMATLLERIYATHNHFQDWRTCAEAGLRAATALGAREGQAALHESLGRLARMMMRLDEATHHHRAAAHIHRELGDVLGEVKSRNGLAWTHLFAHRLEQAREELTDALTAARGLDTPYWTATVLYSLGYTNLQLQRPNDAGPCLQEAMDLFRSLDDPLYEALVLTAWSLLDRARGSQDFGVGKAERAVEIARERDNTLWEGTALLYLGKAQRAGGAAESALESYHRASVIFRREGDLSREAMALDGTGSAYRILQRYDEAVDFHRRATAMFRALADRWKLAKSLGYLAGALEQRSGTEQARAVREEVRSLRCEALEILQDYTDPRSVVLCQRLRGAVHTSADLGADVPGEDESGRRSE